MWVQKKRRDSKRVLEFGGSSPSFSFRLMYFMYVSTLPACMNVRIMCVTDAGDARRGHEILRCWSHGAFRHRMDAETLIRGENVLNHRSISPALLLTILLGDKGLRNSSGKAEDLLEGVEQTQRAPLKDKRAPGRMHGRWDGLLATSFEKTKLAWEGRKGRGKGKRQRLSC